MCKPVGLCLPDAKAQRALSDVNDCHRVSQGISLFCLLFLQRNCLPEKASGFHCFLIHCGALMESGSTYDVRVCKWHLEGGQEVWVTMGSLSWCLGSSSPAFFWGSSPGSSFIPQVSFTLKRIKSVFKLRSNDWIGDEIIPHQTPKSNFFLKCSFLAQCWGEVMKGTKSETLEAGLGQSERALQPGPPGPPHGGLVLIPTMQGNTHFISK